MPRESPSTVYYMNAVIGIFLTIVGIIIVFIGYDLLGYLRPTTYLGVTISMPTFLTASAWLIMVLGVAEIVYGLKRTIDGIAKGRGLAKPRK